MVFAEDLNGAEPPLGASSSLSGAAAGVTITRLSSPSQRGLSVVSFRGNAPGTPQFDSAPANCPDTSKLGTVRVDSPEFLDHPLFGGVYLATPGENPFGTLLALYLTVEDPASGIIVKLPARVDSDPATGGLRRDPRRGPAAPLRRPRPRTLQGHRRAASHPAVCATYDVETQLTPVLGPRRRARGGRTTPSRSPRGRAATPVPTDPGCRPRPHPLLAPAPPTRAPGPTRPSCSSSRVQTAAAR